MIIVWYSALTWFGCNIQSLIGKVVEIRNYHAFSYHNLRKFDISWMCKNYVTNLVILYFKGTLYELIIWMIVIKILFTFMFAHKGTSAF